MRSKADYDPKARRRPRHSLAINFIKDKRVHRQSSYSPTKIKLRQQLVDAMGARRMRVLDTFCGRGDMHQAVWHQCAAYHGIDQEWVKDERLQFVGDNREILRALDLYQWNVFDLDPFGSPWEQAYILSARRHVRKRERVGIVVTAGDVLKVKAGSFPLGLRAVMGVPWIPGMAAQTMDLPGQALRRVIHRMGAKPVRWWQAHSRVGSGLAYIGAVLEAS